LRLLQGIFRTFTAAAWRARQDCGRGRARCIYPPPAGAVAFFWPAAYHHAVVKQPFALIPASLLLGLFLLAVPASLRAQERPGPAQAQAARSYPVQPGRSFRDCIDCPEMMVIPAGQFMMGSPATEVGRYSNEGPQRAVALRAPLAVGVFEVTFAEWDACSAAGACTHRPHDQGWGRGRQPVVNVSWDDTHQFLRWLSARTGRQYRLLTEAEWEFAARAGSSRPFTTGSAINETLANYGNNLARTRPVGSYQPNAFGLFDMHGNVWEWVQDCLERSYANAPSDAAEAVIVSGCAWRVVRGGSWSNAPQFLRSAMRHGVATGNRADNIGFRVAR
jgi:formylglycine-generating enzyme required for sulfatase activity